MFDLALTNARLALPHGVVPGTVGVAGGRIAAIGDASVSWKAADTIDARGHLVLPGVIDIHVHFRDPGLTYKEDFATGSRAAAKGGVTTVGDMPNNKPAITTAARFAEKQRAVAPKAHVDYLLWAGASSADEIPGFAAAGAIGLKVFLTKFERREAVAWTGAESPLAPELFVDDDAVLWDIFKQAAEVDLPVAVHLGNQWLLRRALYRWDGKPFAAIADDLRRQPGLGHVEAARRCVLFARDAGAHLHFVHIPPAVIPVIEEAKREGVRLTAESFCPFMSFDLMKDLGPLGYNRYQSPEGVEALWGALRAGTVDAIATDHAPHTLEEKLKGHEDILACPSGYPEVETSFPMLFDEVMRGGLTLERLVELMCSGPARVVGIAGRKGAIAVGLDADFVVVDPDAEWTIASERLETKCKWTPFAGRRLRGYPRLTILRGRVIMRDGEIVGEAGYGQFLTKTARAASPAPRERR